MRSAAVQGCLPAADTPLTLTASNTAWANGSYVEFSASASSPLSLTGLQIGSSSLGTEHEIGVAIGAAASEVEIASFRSGTAAVRVAPMYLPIPISGLGGNRVAARHRNNNGSGSPTITAKILTLATEDASLTTTSPLTSAPNAAGGSSITYNGSAWANSSYAELTSGLGVPMAFLGICFITSAVNADMELEVATGAAASEVTLTTFRGYFVGTTQPSWIRLPGVHEVPASTRVAIRVRKSGTATGGTTTAAAIYYSDLEVRVPLQRVTQQVLIYGYNRYVDEDPPPVEDACTGGGTVASGSNPSDGAALTTATALHAWIETTIGGTTYRWAKVGINHGNPKTPRVLSFGKLTTALSDDNGGFESASMRILLSDYDRTLRGLHVTQTLMNKSVSVYVADEATIRAGGNPWRVFRGVVRDFRPESELKYRITIEDPLTLAMSAFSQEKLVPTTLLSITDGNADQGLRQTPAPRLYGSLTEEGGAIELPFIGTQTPIGHAELGNRHRHLFGLGAIGNITAIFRADPESGDPPTQRSACLESEYDNDFLAPHISPGWYEATNYLVIDDARWTILDLEQTHPAADLARYGRIPLTANVCGIETTGDGTGATINSLPRQALHALNNEVAQTVGDENWKAIATRDSYALFDTSSFETVKTASENRIPGGYRGAWVFGHSFKQITVRELLRQLSLSGNFDFGINRHGQIMVTMLDRTADTSSLTHFTDQSDIIKDSFSIDPCLDSIENRVRYAYRRNYVKALQQTDEPDGTRLPREPFDKTWISDIQTTNNTSEQTALGEVRESKLLELEMVRDEDVAVDVAAQRLALRSPSNGRAEASFDVTLGRGHSVELGNLIKVTHFQGLGASGWSANVCQVRRREVDLDRFTVTFTVRDVDDLMGESAIEGLVNTDNPITIDGDPIVV